MTEMITLLPSRHPWLREGRTFTDVFVTFYFKPLLYISLCGFFLRGVLEEMDGMTG